MTTCFYKKTFLKDLANLPSVSRKRIEKLVFDEIPAYNNIFEDLDIKKMKGYKRYYRIRTGRYRIGCLIEENNKITFYRVKSREDIYKVFP